MTDMLEIILHDRNAGHHFFDPETMRCFNSRVSSITHGNYFVTSERQPSYQGHTYPRLYHIRYCFPETGHIKTVSTEYGDYYTAREAHAEAERLHRTNPSNTDEL
jgi:hypothetical protein